MIQVGKTYEVVNPEAAENLGFANHVKILREENGAFLGDNDYLYRSNGRIIFDDPLGETDTIHLAKEVEE